jgi:hypothetical protein
MGYKQNKTVAGSAFEPLFPPQSQFDPPEIPLAVALFFKLEIIKFKAVFPA